VPVQRIVDVVSGYFTPAVAILAILGFMAWYTFGPAPAAAYALIVAVTTLIIACPCALGMATPMSLTTGVGLGALNGILFRGGEALQTAQGLQTIVLDKTGTITHGKPVLTDVVVTGTIPPAEVLHLVASVERLSEHPLAAAIVEGAVARGLGLADVVKGGYTPDAIVVERGKPVRLNFVRQESAPCSEMMVLPAFNRSAKLPEGETVSVEFLPTEAGEYEFTCQMGMLRGRVIVEE
jgi:Cu+-exporting ATPase